MRNIFEDLFVLEMANNHWGSITRGLRIIAAYQKVARFNNVRAAVKLQFRDVPTFIHKDFLKSEERYITKTLATALVHQDFMVLVNAVRKSGMVTMATPFDEVSAEWCRDLDVVKIASSDINDWFLIEAIAKLRKPVVVSTAGSSQKDIDDLVAFFEHRGIPLAINHCVALYPAEDGELDLNQIDFLRDRYPGHTIGLSTHEHSDWTSSMMIAYAKGARTFERHVDIEYQTEDGGGKREEGTQTTEEGSPTPPSSVLRHASPVLRHLPAVSPYCSLPHQVDEWFRAYKKAKEMCGGPSTEKRIPSDREIRYLDKLVRGAYARQDMAPGHYLSAEDLYFAIPLQKGQLSSREMLLGQWGHRVVKEIKKDQPLTIDAVDTPYGENPALRELICQRGI